jgi:pimeloyl-ACP methyl ester carboxylesterase
MSEAPYVEVSGACAFVESAGVSQPVLCIHSAGQSGVQWRRTLRELPEKGYRVIVPDLPGHGRSDPAAGGPVTDLATYRQWCLALLEQLAAPGAFVIGCSIGGKIALDIATTASDSVAGVVAMAADAKNSRLSVKGLQRELEDAGAPSRTDRTYYGTLACVGRSVPAARAEHIAVMHRREDPIVTTSDLIGWTTHDLRDRLGRISCGVRLVVGEDDYWVDAEDAAWTARQIPGCRFELLERVGHYPMEELADFPDRLAGWLEELASSKEAAV